MTNNIYNTLNNYNAEDKGGSDIKKEDTYEDNTHVGKRYTKDDI